MNIKEYRSAIERKKGELSLTERRIAEAKNNIANTKSSLLSSEEAQSVAQIVASETQKQLEFHVSELVSLAMASVFDDPWNLILEFVPRRGKTECDLIWEKANGKRAKDLTFSGGGGEVGVAASGLQFAMFYLRRPKPRMSMFLDEPGHFAKGGDIPERNMAMIKEISSQLGLQIIMVSHIQDQIEAADSVFFFTKKFDPEVGYLRTYIEVRK